jgi:S1-C subfamily serine protease
MNLCHWRCTTLLALVCIPALSGDQNRADDPGLSLGLPDTIDRVRATIVRITTVCTYQAGSGAFEEGSGGTGFWVSEAGFILTAAHVISACSPRAQGGAANQQGNLKEQRYNVGLALNHTATDQTNTRDNFTFIDADIIDADPTHDVALLKARQNLFQVRIKSGYTLNGAELELPRPKSARLSTRKVREGESIAISGYPLSQAVFDTNAGIVASIHSGRDIIFPPNSISAMERVQVRLDFDLYEADMSVNPGNSGGPVYYASSGDVIGVCTAYRVAQVGRTTGNSGLAVIVPVAYGNMLLSKHGIATTFPAAAPAHGRR